LPTNSARITSLTAPQVLARANTRTCTHTHDTHTLTHETHTHTHIHAYTHTHIHTYTHTHTHTHTWMLAIGALTVLLTRHFAVAKRNNDNNDKNNNSKMILAERARIEALDGRVEWRGCWRVMGGNGAAAFRGLAISRLSSFQYASFASVRLFSSVCLFCVCTRPFRWSFCVWIRPGVRRRSLARLGYLQGIT
jgi:hypothetical protein